MSDLSGQLETLHFNAARVKISLINLSIIHRGNKMGGLYYESHNGESVEDGKETKEQVSIYLGEIYLSWRSSDVKKINEAKEEL